MAEPLEDIARKEESPALQNVGRCVKDYGAASGYFLFGTPSAAGASMALVSAGMAVADAPRIDTTGSLPTGYKLGIALGTVTLVLSELYQVSQR